jgi:predicted RNA-binding protein with PIN domain
MERLIIIDGYNLIHRSERLRPGPNQTLQESRDKLINLLQWTLGGGGEVQFLVVFDGAESGGGDRRDGRVEVRYSRPPRKADDVIRQLVEKHIENDDQVTVVTADLEVARHARAMGADVSLSDLFLASLFPTAEGEEPEKPTSLTQREIEEWAEIFRRRGAKDRPN